MNRPLKIGVTGGIGSGKTLICQIFSKLGIPVFNADDRAKWLMLNNIGLKKRIIKTFGSESFLPDSTLNREFLAQKLFNNPEQLGKLNAMVHPAVGKDFEKFVAENNDKAYVIKEAALIFESGSHKNLDYTINVFAPEELRIGRVLKRDPQRDEDQVKAITNRQLKDDERAQLADFEINNDGEHLIILQVLDLHQKFMSLPN